MRTLNRFALLAVAGVLLSGCSDVKNPVAPDDASALRLPPGGGGGWPYPDPYAKVFREISAGYNHTCARTKDGTMYCWGQNMWGQVGVPSTGTCGYYGYGQSPCVAGPTRVTGSGTVNGVTTQFLGGTTIRAGGSHTCALSSGTAWCWGTNWYGEAGDGTGGSPSYTNVPSPKPVAGSLSFSAIETGGFATCGISNSGLYCWGNIGLFSGVKTPTLYSWSISWAPQLSVGDSHACVKNLNGWWGCWGTNTYGQVGLDPTSWPLVEGPLGSGVTQSASRVEAGGQFTCADQSNGTVLCQGDDRYGQLGDAGSVSSSFEPVAVGGGMQLHGVTAGTYHACALDVNDAAVCWGYNYYGEIGNGQSQNTLFTPTPVSPPAGSSAPLQFVALAAGAYHTCGIGYDNYIYCWGNDFHGQLGRGANTSLINNISSVPVRTLDPQ